MPTMTISSDSFHSFRRFLRERCAPPPPTELDIRMMRRALDLARAAFEAGEAPIGALIYATMTGEVLAEARNDREASRDPTGHAELIVLRAAARRLGDWRLNSCTLVVTLEPCCMCAGAIVNARVGRLVYGARDPKAGGVRSLYRLLQDPRLNHRLTPIPGILADESAALLRRFFSERRTRTPDMPDRT